MTRICQTTTATEGAAVDLGHCWPSLLIIFGSCLMFAVTATFNGLATAGVTGLFVNGTGNVSALYFVQITPDGWVFSSVWTMIYIYQVFFLAYGLLTVFKRVDGPNSPYLYRTEYSFCIGVYMCYIINMVLNLTWLFIWDKEQLWRAGVVIFHIQFFLYVILYLMLRHYPSVMHRYSCGCTLETFLRGAAQNAIAIYAGWLTIAPLVNLAVCLSYGGPAMAQIDSSTTMAAILLVALLVWFPLEMTVFRMNFIGLQQHFIPLLLAPIGIMTKIGDPSERNWILALVILMVVVVALVAKIVVTVICWKKCSTETGTGSTRCRPTSACGPDTAGKQNGLV